MTLKTTKDQQNESLAAALQYWRPHTVFIKKVQNALIKISMIRLQPKQP